jgi:hypothetical protein
MVKKIIGYILLVAGALAFALSYPAIKTALKIPIPAGITDNIMMILGIAVALVGAWFAFKGSADGRHAAAEVPIYEGGKIIGYRRT